MECRAFQHKVRGEWREIERAYFLAMTRDQASEWTLKKNGVEIIDEAVLGKLSVAEPKETKGSSIYVRLSMPLKTRIAKSAEDERLSVNAWILHCCERCAQLDRVGSILGEIMQTALSFKSGSTRHSDQMIDHMGEQAATIAHFLGWTGKDLENLRTTAAMRAGRGFAGHREWPKDKEAL